MATTLATGFFFRQWIISITGTKDILSNIRDIININGGCLRQVTLNNTWQLSFQANHHIYVFINYIYKDTTVSLTRKRLLCTKFLKEYNEHI